MHGCRAIGFGYIAFLRRTIALLLSFAWIAERAATYPAPLRISLICIMRRAEAAAFRLTDGVACELHIYLDDDQAGEEVFGSDPDAALRLAAQFRLLAQTLEMILYFATHAMPQTAWSAGWQGWNRHARRLPDAHIGAQSCTALKPAHAYPARAPPGSRFSTGAEHINSKPHPGGAAPPGTLAVVQRPVRQAA